MEDMNLFPLSRNKYFFGKLLTQRDMEAEQRYFNNKRRILNILLYGPGVVCGMGVLKVDGVTVAVESGLALDGTGRELTMDKPVVTRLSDIEGFEEDMGLAQYVYLCAEYAETPREPMHALTGSALEENRYGRVEESVRLYLRHGEPEAYETDWAEAGDRYAEALERKLERGEKARIYLARIHLVRWGDAYEIDRIDPLPFRQKAVLPTIPPAAPEPPDLRPAAADGHPVTPPPPRVSGAAIVEIPGGARFGSLHYSEDIVHGLGLTGAFITLGLQTGNETVFGDPSIFQPREYEWAAKVNETDGSFRIGVRLRTDRPERVLTFLWAAEASSHCADLPAAPDIIVTPGSIRLTSRQTVQFTATVRGLPLSDIIWSAGEQDSGGITKDGFYVAPHQEGVYTIRAASASRPDVAGAAYVVVTRL